MLKTSRARTGAKTRVLIVMRPAIIGEAAACRRRAARILAEPRQKPGLVACQSLVCCRPPPDPVDRHQDVAAAATWATAPCLPEDQLDGHGQPALGRDQTGLEPLPTFCARQTAAAAARHVDCARRAQVPDQARE